jgi:hypothetical protein
LEQGLEQGLDLGGNAVATLGLGALFFFCSGVSCSTPTEDDVARQLVWDNFNARRPNFSPSEPVYGEQLEPDKKPKKVIYDKIRSMRFWPENE